MVARALTRRATYADLEDIPPHVVGEILDGVLHTRPRPAPRHARASSSLGVKIGAPFDHGTGGPGGWWILDEPELHLGKDDVLVPDIAGWRRERMPKLPEAAAFELPPDWACEVLSPATAAVDREKKLPIYAREAVPHVWLVDPIVRTLEVLRLDGSSYRIVGVWSGDACVHAEPFDVIELELGVLWAE